jgi:hypothetical protein
MAAALALASNVASGEPHSVRMLARPVSTFVGDTVPTATPLLDLSAARRTSQDPTPLAKDLILLDSRRALQSAKSPIEALGIARLGSATLGTKIMYEMAGPWALSTDIDGRGTHAYRIDWKSWGGRCRDQSANIIPYFATPYQTHILISWKTRLGRTPTGGGVGAINSFQITNPRCGGYNNTGGNAGRKALLVARNVRGMGAAGRIEYLWAGPPPAKPKVTSDALGLSFDVLRGSYFDFQQHVGEVITQTVELKASSAPGARDGIVRVWINGMKVIENIRAPIGPEAFHRFQLPSVFNSPSADQTEYVWDILAWTPAASVRDQ